MRLNHTITRVCIPLLLAIAASCAKEKSYGIDYSKVGPSDVRYDEYNSSSSSLGVYWEVDKAIAAGATGFTAQIIKDERIGADGYSGAEPKTSSTLLSKNRPNDGTIFSGLTENAKYYARVRANYPESTYSDWVYVLNDKGERAVIKVGTGIVDEPIEIITQAKLRLVNVSSATACVSWSISDFADKSTDISADATIELYSDEDLTELAIAWEINNHQLYKGVQPAFTFTGLKPATDYWCLVTCKTADGKSYQSETLKFTTEISKLKLQPAVASEGECFLFQDFSELIWGGDIAFRAMGYSAEKRSSVSSLTPAQGWNPINDQTYGYYLVDYATESGLYNSIGKALKGSGCSLAEWYELNEGDNKSGGMVCARPGYVKLGASNKIGWIVTPELSCLLDVATIEVKFRASVFSTEGDTPDKEDASILLLSGIEHSNRIITGYTSKDIAAEFKLDNSFGMREYTLEIPNVEPGMSIAIGAARPDGGNSQRRMLVDDIRLTLKQYGSVVVYVPKPVVSLTTGEGFITATWAPVNNGKTYIVEYKKSSTSTWQEAGVTADQKFTIKGLEQKTKYDVRVKAKATGSNVSDYSDVKSITTPAVSTAITAEVVLANESQLGFRWVSGNDKAADINTRYCIELFRDEACTSLITRLTLAEKGIPDASVMKITNAVLNNQMKEIWVAATGPCFMFSGLNSNTAYTLKITNRDLNISQKITASTQKSNWIKKLNTTATAGDTILYEDFHEFNWGGYPIYPDYNYGLPGYNSEYRSFAKAFWPLEGEQPLSEDSKRLWLCQRNQDMGLFNTIWPAAQSTSIADWAGIIEDHNTVPGGVCMLAGILKVGASEKYAQIVTPKLDCLSSAATLEVSFDMGPISYDGVKLPDPLDAVIKVIEGGTVAKIGSANSMITNYTTAQEKTFTMAANPALKQQVFTFSNVKPGSRIAIGTYRPAGAGAGNRRAFIDNIRIKVIEYNK